MFAWMSEWGVRVCLPMHAVHTIALDRWLLCAWAFTNLPSPHHFHHHHYPTHAPMLARPPAGTHARKHTHARTLAYARMPFHRSPPLPLPPYEDMNSRARARAQAERELILLGLLLGGDWRISDTRSRHIQTWDRFEDTHASGIVLGRS